MIVFIGATRGTLRSHKTSVADLQDLRLTQNLKPCHYISFLGTLHPPIICRAKSAALVFLSCRVARSLVPSPLHSALLLGHSLPGLPTWSRRHHVPSLHRGPTRSRRHHAPALHRGHGLSATSVTSLGLGRHGSRANTSSCAAYC
jgi:hypothetical protein